MPDQPDPFPFELTDVTIDGVRTVAAAGRGTPVERRVTLNHDTGDWSDLSTYADGSRSLNGRFTPSGPVTVAWEV